ncbi:MAG: GNAT family N-acetyltransferase [Gaiellaceae bacterium]|nr:GNAT family N-acetyltransferase [Acidobacteriota bacterium]
MDVWPPTQPLSDGVVTLRPWGDGDVDALVRAIDGDEEITQWLELIPQPYREPEARAWVGASVSMWRDGTASTFAVTADGDVVGGCGVNWIDRDHAVGDIGYWVRRDARGRGYITRAVRLAARWAFIAGCERLQLRADAENVASQRVAERAGFVREGVQRSARYNPRLGRRMDFVVFSLLPGELDRPDAVA